MRESDGHFTVADKPTIENAQLYLVDVSGYLFRSFYALPPMTNPKGMQVQAVFGLARSLVNLRADFQPEYILAVFDGQQGKLKRRSLYPEYKANRVRAPQELIDQIPLAYDLCAALGVPVLMMEDCEADDLIAAAVHQAQRQGVSCAICSSDKDLLQLVNENVYELHTHKDNQRIGPEQVKQQLGINPSQVADWIALCGDSSDNIPGVAGIGPKTAAQLLERYGNLEGIIAHLSELSVKRQQTFDIEMARLSYQLAHLKDVDNWSLKLEEARWNLPKEDAWLPWFEQMGFRSLIKVLQKQAATNLVKANNADTDKTQLVSKSLEGSDAQRSTALTTQLDLFENFIEVKENLVPNVFDVRVVGWKEVAQELLTLKASSALFIDFLEDKKKNPVWLIGSDRVIWVLPSPQESLKPSDFLNNLETALKRHRLVAYHLQVIERLWLDWGLNGPFPWRNDLRLIAHLFFADGRDISPSSLSNHFGLMGFSEWLRNHDAIVDLDLCKIPLDNFICEQVRKRLQTWWELENRLFSSLEPELKNLYQNIELPLASVLARMEHVGIGVNCEILKDLSKVLHNELNKHANNIYSMAGESFNLNSPKQLAQILYDKIGLPVLKRTKTGVSTDAQVLEQLQDSHPIVQEILRYRELEKLRSTYVDALPTFIKSTTQSIHPHFEQTTTSTGRLACHEPNLQNIPVRTSEGLKIRQAFQARKEDWRLVSADYSQVELRVMAHLSEDPTLIRAFEQDQDIHRFTAALVFEIPIDEVSDEQRAMSKAVNFGILYGQQAFGLSRQLGIPVAKASTFIDAYFARYPGVAKYVEDCKRQAIDHGYVKTILGRRRAIPEIRSPKATIRQLGERLSVNTPVQGSAADLIKLAMIRLEEKILPFQAHMILQIHDELIFECHESQVEDLSRVVREQMQSVYPLKVPLVVNIAVGKNWMEC